MTTTTADVPRDLSRGHTGEHITNELATMRIERLTELAWIFLDQADGHNLPHTGTMTATANEGADRLAA